MKICKTPLGGVLTGLAWILAATQQPALAAEKEVTKVGAWSIIAVSNNDGSLNRCLAHLPGPTGLLRIHLNPAKKWALSVPGNVPGLKQLPNTQVWSEVNYENGGRVSGGNSVFKVDASAGRASFELTPDDLKELRAAAKLTIKMFNKPDPCEAGKNCPSKEFTWPLKDIKPALTAVQACVR